LSRPSSDFLYRYSRRSRVWRRLDAASCVLPVEDGIPCALACC